MAEPRTVLVADDATLSQSILGTLHAASLSAHVESYATIPERLTCDSNGLLLLGVATSAEQIAARQLAQQLVLQKWPTVLVMIDALGHASTLAPLDRYVSRRLQWPTDAEQLVRHVRELDRGRQFRFAPDESLEDTLSRRLLALTPSLQIGRAHV